MGYITLSAPYDGVIVARNANTGDFVVPAAGDLTAMERAPYLVPAGHAAPIYVVDRTDVVRIFVDIPEQDANYVHVGTKATVLARRTVRLRSRAPSRAPPGPQRQEPYAPCRDRPAQPRQPVRPGCTPTPR